MPHLKVDPAYYERIPTADYSKFADAINDGWTVCIWDDRRVAPYKDINDMVMGGISAEDITKIILENAHQGLSAKVKFQEWKKV